jgi:lactate dehydrogenase-like 2-hydroxyacid dehydrogenase
VTAASGRHFAVVAGTPSRPFLDGIAAALTTRWDIVAIPDDLSVSVEPIGRAEAVVTVHYNKSWPPAPNLRLLQVPGAGYDGIELAARQH